MLFFPQLYFRNINGTSVSNFEGHLAEIIWRLNLTIPPQTAMLHLAQQHYGHQRADLPPLPYPLFSTWTHVQVRAVIGAQLFHCLHLYNIIHT